MKKLFTIFFVLLLSGCGQAVIEPVKIVEPDVVESQEIQLGAKIIPELPDTVQTRMKSYSKSDYKARTKTLVDKMKASKADKNNESKKLNFVEANELIAMLNYEIERCGKTLDLTQYSGNTLNEKWPDIVEKGCL